MTPSTPLFALAIEAPEPAAPGEDWLRARANLRATFTDAGLEGVTIQEHTYQRHAPAADYLGWQFWGTRGRYLRSITDEATWDRFWRAVLGRLERRFPAGVPSVSSFRLAAATKPDPLSAS
jgi:hypothetical protein